MAQVVVKGLAELQKFLDQLPAKVEANVMRGALRAGMNVVKPAAQANIRSQSGELANGLKVGTRSRGGLVTSNLKTTGRHRWIAHIIEFTGARPHYISVQEDEKPINVRRSIRAGKIVRASMRTVNRVALRIGTKFVGPTVFHPGMKPRPFLRPALDSKAGEAVVAAAEYIKKRLATKHGLDTAHVRIEGDE